MIVGGLEEFLGPSAASIWMRCQGYAALNRSISAAVSEKDVDANNNDVREDGTACHWVVETSGRGLGLPALGDISPNGRTVTEEMHVADAIWRDVLEKRHIVGVGIVVHIEEKAPVSRMFPGMRDGTPDRWYYCEMTNTLYVDDLKFGFRSVDPYWNLQLFIYALTVAMIVLGLSDPKLKIVLTIVQPRDYNAEGPVRAFEFELHEAGPLCEKIRAAVQAAHQPNPVCTTNPGCINCPANIRCNAFIEQGMVLMEFSGSSRPAEMSNAEMAYFLQMMEFAHGRLSGHIAALQSEMEWLMQQGPVVFPGYGMRSARSNRVWNCPPETVATYAKLFGKDLIKQKPVTPRQAEIAGVPQAIVDMLAERRPSPPKLTRLDPDEAARAFGKQKLNWNTQYG